ncbi:ATP-binding protein [Nisaea sediminum]|uniref:ATP-binding protein n=1 Tax=Nisaea sediminum TaxID=2775867 RepID=UPI001867396E|nr:ATP-binding protein [Nisaea sediminum]
MSDARELEILTRIADALERIAPPPAKAADLGDAEGFVWNAQTGQVDPVRHINRVDISLLKGVGPQLEQLHENTDRFARGLPANNALLWGSRGMGKSSLVKAVHAEVNRKRDGILALVEIHREDLETLPRLLNLARDTDRRLIVFCDDLSFDFADNSYKSLKAVLEGGVEGRPTNVLFYATSNRRHLMARDMIDNERSTAINPGEAVEEKVSLSDRFGLWLGFHACDQDTFLSMIEGYAGAYDLPISADELRARAKEWQVTRGARSGRVAWQFIQDLAGDLGKKLD